MGGYLNFGYGALILFLMFLIAGPFAGVGTYLMQWMGGSLMKKQLHGGYRRFYLTDADTSRDPYAKYFIREMSKAYVSRELHDYMARMSEDRLPASVLMNWTKCITEDVASSPLPDLCVERWNKYLKKTGSSKWVFNNSDFIDFEDYELAFIWGSVYCFMTVYYKDKCNESLLGAIERVACPKKYVLPYFLFGKEASERMLKAGQGNVIMVQDASIYVSSPGNLKIEKTDQVNVVYGNNATIQ